MSENIPPPKEYEYPSPEAMRQHDALTSACVDLITANVALWDDNGNPLEIYPDYLEQGVQEVTKKLWLTTDEQGDERVCLSFLTTITGEPVPPTPTRIDVYVDTEEDPRRWTKPGFSHDSPWRFDDFTEFDNIGDEALREYEGNALMAGQSIDESKGEALSAMVDAFAQASKGKVLEYELGLAPFWASAEELQNAVDLLQKSKPTAPPERSH
jgi:hypothetical protein